MVPTPSQTASNILQSGILLKESHRRHVMSVKRGTRTTVKFTLGAKAVKRIKAIRDWEVRSAGREVIFLKPHNPNEKPKTSG